MCEKSVFAAQLRTRHRTYGANCLVLFARRRFCTRALPGNEYGAISMPLLERAREHRDQLEALISRGVGIIEIKQRLGLSYAVVRDMIRLLALPKPLDHRTQRGAARAAARPRDRI
jgi:hypothetical protein